MSQRRQLTAIAVLSVVVAVLAWLVLAPETPSGPRGAAGTTTVTEETQPSALFVGDSFPAGSGAASVDEAVSCLTAAAMEWICNVDAQAGSGFVADGRAIDASHSPLIGRLPADKEKYLADIVVIDAGRNDRHFPDEQVIAAIREYLAAVREAWPRAELVVIEPYFMDRQTPVLRDAVLDVLRAETERHGGHVINPYDMGWIPPGGERKDLDAADHRHIASRLVEALTSAGLDDVAVTDRRVSLGAAG